MRSSRGMRVKQQGKKSDSPQIDQVGCVAEERGEAVFADGADGYVLKLAPVLPRGVAHEVAHEPPLRAGIGLLLLQHVRPVQEQPPPGHCTLARKDGCCLTQQAVEVRARHASHDCSEE
eukprot:3711718-Alexandrium_andersonii.AAC.1